MKITILSLLTLVLLVAIAAVYGALESGANLVEALLLPFTDHTATGALVFGGPFIVLFIAALTVQFVGVPLIASSIAACLGGWALRQSRKSISKRSAGHCISLAAVCAIVFVLVTSQRDGFLPPITATAKTKNSGNRVGMCRWRQRRLQHVGRHIYFTPHNFFWTTASNSQITHVA